MPRRPSTHVDSPAAVGERLRAARHAAGLSQRELSFDGCTAAYVSRIEAGARTPSYQILREFGRRLGVTADYLATGDEGILASDPLIEAEISLRLGELDQAAEIYGRALRESGDERTALRADAGLGHVALARGGTNEAVERLTRALAADGLPFPEAASAAEGLGRTYCLRGQFDEAFAVFKRFLERARERHDRFETSRFSLLLANAYVDSGNLPAAEQALGDALAGAEEILDPALRANLYWSQSRLYRAEAKPELAAEYAQLAVATLRSTEHATAAARALLLQAQLENDRGHGRKALALLDDARRALGDTRDPLDSASETIERARALAQVGEEDEAVALMLGVVGQLSDARPGAAAVAYASAAAFFRERGDDARALELYEQAIDRGPASGRHTADAMTAMAEIHEKRGAADEALRLLKAALAARSGVAAG